MVVICRQHIFESCQVVQDHKEKEERESIILYHLWSALCIYELQSIFYSRRDSKNRT